MAVFAFPAFAIENPAIGVYCEEGDALPKGLTDRFGETMAGQGLDRRGVLFQLYKNDNTWSLLYLNPQTGMACMIADGADWQPVIQGDPT